MKLILKAFLIVFLLTVFSEGTKAQTTIILDFVNKKVSQDGLHWTFDVVGKGDPTYLPPNDNTWRAYNVRLDVQLPAGVTIIGGSGVGDPLYASASIGVQTIAPGNPPPGWQELGLTLERADDDLDLNTTDFVHLATYTIDFSGPVEQGNPASPRLLPTLQGSSWSNPQDEITFRPFTFVEQTFPLPVKLISFSATKERNVAQLNWATSEETNSDRFDIQRSSDGKKWQQIGSVKSKGESKQTAYYSATDSYPLNGSNLYRLHMIDKDGSSAYSKIESVNFEGQAQFIMFPNPLIDQISIKTNDWDKVAKIQIYNMGGKEVYNSASNLIKDINVKNLAAGVYVVKVTQKNNTSSDHKIVISK
ncbi:T9SS type A sorting domain-containing protein [Dyadobacter bucti]|uniref:T9SS type A sorting domain-containing protein n=1 Tax=Dyadobacter bucti TaxID=2572203 RepID=UPI001109EF2B|nr:T9SS type A sorting domain-containing protein [Dyadobacter bucti]